MEPAAYRLVIGYDVVCSASYSLESSFSGLILPWGRWFCFWDFHTASLLCFCWLISGSLLWMCIMYTTVNRMLNMAIIHTCKFVLIPILRGLHLSLHNKGLSPTAIFWLLRQPLSEITSFVNLDSKTSGSAPASGCQKSAQGFPIRQFPRQP